MFKDMRLLSVRPGVSALETCAQICSADKAGTMLSAPHGRGIRDKESPCAEDTRAPLSLQPSFFTKQNTHKSYRCNQYSRLKKHGVTSCGSFHSEDHEIIPSGTRSHERRQAPGPSVNFKEETNINGDLKNEGLQDFHLSSNELRWTGKRLARRSSLERRRERLRLRTENISLV
jgi:hypothetical protein